MVDIHHDMPLFHLFWVAMTGPSVFIWCSHPSWLMSRLCKNRTSELPGGGPGEWRKLAFGGKRSRVRGFQWFLPKIWRNSPPEN